MGRAGRYEQEGALTLMTCMEAEKLVIPYINDRLSGCQLEDFVEHIKTCENCREELEIHYMVDVGLKKLDQGEGTFDILGDMKEKLSDSEHRLNRYLAFQILRYAVGTLSGAAVLFTFLLQLRIWIQHGFLFF